MSAITKPDTTERRGAPIYTSPGRTEILEQVLARIDEQVAELDAMAGTPKEPFTPSVIAAGQPVQRMERQNEVDACRNHLKRLRADFADELSRTVESEVPDWGKRSHEARMHPIRQDIDWSTGPARAAYRQMEDRGEYRQAALYREQYVLIPEQIWKRARR